jgi:hypothetical protein
MKIIFSGAGEYRRNVLPVVASATTGPSSQVRFR